MSDTKRKLNLFARSKPLPPAVVTRSRQSSYNTTTNQTGSGGSEDESNASQAGKKPKKPKVWHPQQEVVLKQWAEIATSFRWLHHQAHIAFSKKSFWITLPVIVISSITGTMNFAQSSFPDLYASYVPLFIGTLNLIAGVMTTVQSYLRLAELAEGHRVASLMFGKLSRNIRVELMLPVTERTMDGDDFIAMSRSEMDRLTEQSPDIPKSIEKKFMVKFEDLLQTDFYPPELLQLHPVEVYHSEAEAEEAKTANVVASAALQLQRLSERAREAREKQKEAKEEAVKPDEVLFSIPEHLPSPPSSATLVAQELKTLNRLQTVSNLLMRRKGSHALPHAPPQSPPTTPVTDAVVDALFAPPPAEPQPVETPVSSALELV